MGRTTWPCPRCGQQQTTEHPNGEAQENRLCAACAEAETFERVEFAQKVDKAEKARK